MSAANYKPCQNPACLRKVSAGSAYCCPGCVLADTPPRFDPDGYHSQDCNARNAERGEFEIHEWDLLRALG